MAGIVLVLGHQGHGKTPLEATVDVCLSALNMRGSDVSVMSAVSYLLVYNGAIDTESVPNEGVFCRMVGESVGGAGPCS